MPTRIKNINGSKYLYYVYYENRKKKDVYCGLSSSPQSEQKALRLELEQLKIQKEKLNEKTNEIESRLEIF